MSTAVHTIDMMTGSILTDMDKLHVGLFPGVATAAGGGPGAPVVTPISIPPLPGNYGVFVNSYQGAAVTITNQTPTGFNLVQTPASNVTLAAGTCDVLVLA